MIDHRVGRPGRPDERWRGGVEVRVIALVLAACKPVEALPIVAPAGLETTMDPGSGGLVIEDDARRHAIPPAAMRRRIYAVDDSVIRWFPPGSRRTRWLSASYLPAVPADHVALRGGPPPRAGQRFVLFNGKGPLGVVEATGTDCPPGHEGCIACPIDDPERRHWAQFLGPSPEKLDDYPLALGPFEPDEPLPAARRMWDADDRQIGRWWIDPYADLDGDGEVDVALAHAGCGKRSGSFVGACAPAETWRLHMGRWYAEPAEPRVSVPMHVMELDLIFGVHTLAELGEEWVALGGSTLDGFYPTAGDYWIVGRPGLVGTVHYPDTRRALCWYDGPPCHPATDLVLAKRHGPGPLLVIGPMPAGVGVRSVKMAQPWWEARAWDPNRAATAAMVELADGRRWTITRRPCARVDHQGSNTGMCHEAREDGGAGPRRWMSGAFNTYMNFAAEPVCSRMAEPTTRSRR